MGYFDDITKGAEPASSTPPAAPTVKSQFFEDQLGDLRPPEPMGRLRSAAGSFVQGAADVAADIPRAAAIAGTPLGQVAGLLDDDTKPQDTFLYKAGEAFSDAAKKYFPSDPRYAGEFIADVVPRAAGSTAGFLAGGAAGAAAKIPALATTMAMGSASGASQQFQDALQKGATIGQAYESAGLGAALGTSEALPIAHALERLDKGTGGSVRRLLVETAKGATEEGLQETLQQIGQNLIANRIVGYNPEQETFEGVGQAGAAGFTVGGLFNFLLTAIGGRGARAAAHRERSNAAASSAPPDEAPPGSGAAPQLTDQNADFQNAPQPGSRVAADFGEGQVVNGTVVDYADLPGGPAVRLKLDSGEDITRPLRDVTLSALPAGALPKPETAYGEGFTARPAAAEAPTPQDATAAEAAIRHAGGFEDVGPTERARDDLTERPMPALPAPATKYGEGFTMREPEPTPPGPLALPKPTTIYGEGFTAKPAEGDGSRESPIPVRTTADVLRGQERTAEPTEAQKDAGNYRKRHLTWNGLDIAIETERGQERKGIGPNGKPWSVRLPSPYGYVKGTKGRDGEQVDIYMGPRPEAQTVYVVDQIDPRTGKFDEHKAMLGYANQGQAVTAYRRAFSDNSGAQRAGAITPMSVDQFKAWLDSGETKKPLTYTEQPPAAAPEAPQREAPAAPASPEEQAAMRAQARSDAARKAMETRRAQHGPLNLFQFIAASGGIRPDDANIGDLHKVLGRKQVPVPMFGVLVRSGGMTMDEARARAEEAGYIGRPASSEQTSGDYQTTDLNDLLDAIDRQSRGAPVFSHKDVGEVQEQAREAAAPEEHEREQEALRGVQAVVAQYQIPATEAEMRDAAAMVREGADALDAISDVVERAALAEMGEDTDIQPETPDENPTQAAAAIPAEEGASGATPPGESRAGSQPADAEAPEHAPPRVSTGQDQHGAGTAGKTGEPAVGPAAEPAGPRRTAEPTERPPTEEPARGAEGPQHTEAITEPAPEAGSSSEETDRALLAGLPEGSHFIRGRGLAADKWGVADANDKLIWDLHDTKEAAADAARERIKALADNAARREQKDAQWKEIADRIRAGGEPTDADLRALDLKPRAGFEYISPVVQKLFGISRAKVREAMGDAVRSGTTDSGRTVWFANSKKALANAARFGREGPAAPTTERTDAGEQAVIPGAERLPNDPRALLDRYRAIAADLASAQARKDNETTQRLVPAATEITEAYVKASGKPRAEAVADIDAIYQAASDELPEAIAPVARRAKETIQPKKPQKAADEGLFDTGARRQTDLLDVAPRPPAAEEVAPKAPVEQTAETPAAEQPKPDTAEPAAATAEAGVKPYTLADQTPNAKRIMAGEITAEELKAEFRRLAASEDAVKAELNAKGLKELAPKGTRGATKKEVVDSIYDRMLQRFNVKSSYAWDPFKETSKQALTRVVESTTDDDIKAYAEDLKKRREDRERMYTNPQTLYDFHAFVELRGKDALTPEQQKRYDELIAEDNRKQAERKEAEKATVKQVDTGNVGMSITETKHTQKGHDLFVVKLEQRVDNDTFKALNTAAKRLGGYYSSFAKNGAVPGFQFRSREDAERFVKVREEDVSRAPIAERREEEVKGNAVERLRDMADKMTAEADESLSADRKVNTERRARQAAGAEAVASANKALAATMRNLADAIESGDAKHLDSIRTRTDVETLSKMLRRARYEWAQAEAKAGRGRISELDEKPITEEMVSQAQYPYPYAHRENAMEMAKETSEMAGLKLASRRLAKRAQQAERRGEWRVTAENLAEQEDLREVAKGATRTRAKYTAEGVLDTFNDYNRLQRMGLVDLPTLRAALREFLQYRGTETKADPIKAAERALVGRKIPGYFPTPDGLAQRVVDEADIRPGMTVLEPSAGKGNIADKALAAIGDEGAVSVIEPVSDLRTILEAKGHNIVDRDFLEHQEKYDRIVMNPPFEDRQDVAHVRHAYDLLKPGGRVVAIMSEGPFFGQDKTAAEFREWLDSVGGVSEQLPEGSFKDSERSTGVATRLVTIDKPDDAKFAAPRDVTSTPEFKNWFRESKVVDDDGNPLVVYHGSSRRFGEFKPTESFRNVGGRPESVTSPSFFFSTDRDTAEMFARDRVKIDEKLRDTKPGKPIVRPFYLSIQNPLDFEITPEVRARMSEDGYSAAFNPNAPSPYAAQEIEDIAPGTAINSWQDVQAALDDPAIVDELRARGYDGARLTEDDGSTAWAAFSPEQIKSPDNRGAFSPEDARVTYAASRQAPSRAERMLLDDAQGTTQSRSFDDFAKKHALQDRYGNLYPALRAHFQEVAKTQPQFRDALAQALRGLDADLRTVAEAGNILPDGGRVDPGRIVDILEQGGYELRDIANRIRDAQRRAPRAAAANTAGPRADAGGRVRGPASDRAGDRGLDTKALFTELRSRLNRVGLADVRIGVTDVIRDARGNATPNEGVYRPTRKVIEVAFQGTAPRTWTLDHETVHALRDLGLFTAQEWATLQRAALDDKGRMADIRRRYADQNLGREALIEEAIADSYADWAAGNHKVPGAIDRLYQKIAKLFEAIANVFRGHGFRTAEDVFSAIREGEIGRRPRPGDETTGEAMFAKAAPLKTEAFKKWFGDSKVVDENGEPLVVYHGTNKKFDRFDENEQRGYGFHFGTEDQAKMRAHPRDRVIMPVYLSIKNPKRMKDTAGSWRDAVRSAKRAGNDGIVYLNRYEGIPAEAFDRARKELAARRGMSEDRVNFDALSDAEFRRLVPEARDSYVAFEPTQIKSVNNRGTFNPQDERVSYSVPRTTTPDAVNPDEPKARRSIAQHFMGMRDWLKKAGDPFGKLPDADAYQIARGIAQGRIGLINEEARKTYDLFRNAPAETQKQIYQYLTDKDATPASITDPQFRDPAVIAKRRIDRIGRALVMKGLISQETYDAHKGSYLPRLYLRHVLDENPAAIGYGRKTSEQGYTRKRQDISPEVRALMGEIKDPGFLSAYGIAVPMRDLAIIDFLDDIAEGKQWVWQGDVVKWRGQKVSTMWLANEADQIRKVAQATADPEQRAKLLETSRQMDEAIDERVKKTGQPPRNYKRLPESKRYGALRGMHVREEIYSDIVGSFRMMSKDASVWERLFGIGGTGTRITQAWKMGKVALNPPSQVRNFVSNFVLLHMSGVPLHRTVERVIQAASEMKNGGRHWDVAKKYGIASGSFSANELFEINREIADLRAREGGVIAKALKIASTIARKASDSYQFSESLFKTAKIIDAMERQGKTAEQAVLDANKWLFDYSAVPNWVRVARNAPIGAPFLTFSYKVFPRIIEAGIDRPWMFAPYVALGYALSAAIASEYDVDRDDLEKLKKGMATWMQEKGSVYALPWKDEKGRWQFVDMGYFFPWSPWQDLANNMATGDLTKTVGGSGFFGGPILDILTAIKTGKDSFTNRDIVDASDPPSKQMQDILAYVWRMAAPTWITDVGAMKHISDSITGTPNRKGEPPATLGQALLRMGGVNVYPAEIEQQRAENIKQYENEIQKIKARMSYRLKDQSLSADQRATIAADYTEMIQDKANALAKYTRDSEINPKLATGH